MKPGYVLAVAVIMVALTGAGVLYHVGNSLVPQVEASGISENQVKVAICNEESTVKELADAHGVSEKSVGIRVDTLNQRYPGTPFTVENDTVTFSDTHSYLWDHCDNFVEADS